MKKGAVLMVSKIDGWMDEKKKKSYGMMICHHVTLQRNSRNKSWCDCLSITIHVTGIGEEFRFVHGIISNREGPFHCEHRSL